MAAAASRLAQLQAFAAATRDAAAALAEVASRQSENLRVVRRLIESERVEAPVAKRIRGDAGARPLPLPSQPLSSASMSPLPPLPSGALVPLDRFAVESAEPAAFFARYKLSVETFKALAALVRPLLVRGRHSVSDAQIQSLIAGATLGEEAPRARMGVPREEGGEEAGAEDVAGAEEEGSAAAADSERGKGPRGSSQRRLLPVTHQGRRPGLSPESRLLLFLRQLMDKDAVLQQLAEEFHISVALVSIDFYHVLCAVVEALNRARLISWPDAEARRRFATINASHSSLLADTHIVAIVDSVLVPLASVSTGSQHLRSEAALGSGGASGTNDSEPVAVNLLAVDPWGHIVFASGCHSSAEGEDKLLRELMANGAVGALSPGETLLGDLAFAGCENVIVPFPRREARPSPAIRGLADSRRVTQVDEPTGLEDDDMRRETNRALLRQRALVEVTIFQLRLLFGVLRRPATRPRRRWLPLIFRACCQLLNFAYRHGGTPPRPNPESGVPQPWEMMLDASFRWRDGGMENVGLCHREFDWLI